jgi:hypothetical protein
MAQIFHRATNPLSKASIFGGIFIIGAFIYVFDLLYTGPYVNEESVIREQPVPFSHKHHAKELGIDCRFCHTSVETSSFAGIPSVKTCMTCHSQIWNKSPMLAPIRDAYRTGEPIRWVRVNVLPDYVYFDHSIHVAKGIGCTTCHGPMGDMPLSWRQASLQMKWCLECHRHPEDFVRQHLNVFDSSWRRPPNQHAQGLKLVQEYHIKSLTDCYTCHR